MILFSNGFFICGFSAKVTFAFLASAKHFTEIKTFCVRKTTFFVKLRFQWYCYLCWRVTYKLRAQSLSPYQDWDIFVCFPSPPMILPVEWR